MSPLIEAVCVAVRGVAGRMGRLGIKNHPPGRNREGVFAACLCFLGAFFDFCAILLDECGGHT